MKAEKVQFENRALRGRIIEKYGTIESFALRAGRSRQSCQYILSGRSDMTRSTMVQWAKLLSVDLDSPEMFRLFLSKHI